MDQNRRTELLTLVRLFSAISKLLLELQVVFEIVLLCLAMCVKLRWLNCGVLNSKQETVDKKWTVNSNLWTWQVSVSCTWKVNTTVFLSAAGSLGIDRTQASNSVHQYNVPSRSVLENCLCINVFCTFDLSNTRLGQPTTTTHGQIQRLGARADHP